MLVVGGGKIALQKIKALTPCAAKITVVAKDADPSLRRWAGKNKLKLILRPFRERDLAGKDLVFCATNDGRLNARVSSGCRKRKIGVNVADQPALCTFIVPAVVRRGEVTFAISTGGAAPALAKFLRKKVEENFGAEIARLARRLKKMRARILKIPIPARRKVLAEILKDRTPTKKRGNPNGKYRTNHF